MIDSNTREADESQRESGGSFVVAVLTTLFLTSSLLGLGCDGGTSIQAVKEQQAAGNYGATVAPLRGLLAESPKDPELNFLYGRALIMTGQPGLSTWALRQAMQSPDWKDAAGMQLAHAFLLTTDFNEVVDVTSGLLADDPENAMALLYRAQARAHWKNDAAAALADAQRVLELDPDLIEAYEPLILALLALDRHPEAREALDEAGRRMVEADSAESGLAWHCSTSGIFALEANDLEAAREIWDDCTARFPTDLGVVANAVHFHEAHHEWDRSLEILRTAVERAPDNSSFRSWLAERLRFTGNPEEGEEILLQATNADAPRQAATAWIDLSSYRATGGDFAGAAEALGHALEEIRKVEKPAPQLVFEYADLLVAAGEFERAASVTETIQVPAQRALLRARIEQKRGRPTRALELFDEALRLWPDNAVAHYYTAIAAEQVGQFERALEEYRYAIRTSLAATDARTRAARLLISQGQPGLAYQLLFLQIKEAPLEPEGEILSMYLMGLAANPSQLRSSLVEFGSKDPARLPLALARGAEGAAERVGAAAALPLLRDAPGADYTEPAWAPALRQLVKLAHGSGEPELADSSVEAALAANPSEAVFHEILGLQRELAGAPSERVRSAYAEAVALDPSNARALEALGRLDLQRDPAAALERFDAAAATGEPLPEARLGAARALRALDRHEEAVERLDALLVDEPFLWEAAAELVSIDLERDRVTAETLERARRAARFGGGAEALDELSVVYARLDQPEMAERAARQAQLRRNQRTGEG